MAFQIHEMFSEIGLSCNIRGQNLILCVNEKYHLFNIVYFISISVSYIQNSLFISDYMFMHVIKLIGASHA